MVFFSVGRKKGCGGGRRTAGRLRALQRARERGCRAVKGSRGEGRTGRVPVDGEYNTSSPTRRFTTKKRGPRRIYWLESGEFMRRIALAGGFTRDEKPKFLSFSDDLASYARPSFDSRYPRCFAVPRTDPPRNWRFLSRLLGDTWLNSLPDEAAKEVAPSG